MDDLQAYVDKRMRETGIDTLTAEDLDRFLDEWAQIISRTPISEVEGYALLEMDQLIHQLFEKDCPAQLMDFTAEDCLQVPLFRQVKLLLETIGEEKSVKLTPKGNLPVRIVKSVYAVGVKNEYIESGPRLSITMEVWKKMRPIVIRTGCLVFYSKIWGLSRLRRSFNSLPF